METDRRDCMPEQQPGMLGRQLEWLLPECHSSRLLPWGGQPCYACTVEGPVGGRVEGPEQQQQQHSVVVLRLLASRGTCVGCRWVELVCAWGKFELLESCAVVVVVVCVVGGCRLAERQGLFR